MQSDTHSTKPEFRIDLSKGATSSLEALAILYALDPSEGHDLARSLRPPLGIYNISIKVHQEVKTEIKLWVVKE